MRIIGHLDMDAFFAAIEERDNPRFKGLPLVVGADPKGGTGRGVVSTANYKAREYGIHSAMPISIAWRLAEAARRQGKPGAIFLGVNMRRYAQVSERVMAVIRENVPLIEEASVDEAYLDLDFTGSYDNAEALTKKIKQEIREKEKLTASVGIGPNKLIAKIASGTRKPDGLTVIYPELAQEFLDPLSIRAIPGIGPKTEELFAGRGIRTVHDLRRLGEDELREMLGKWGLDLYQKVRGQDDSPVIEEYEAKSIGEQETFEKDSKDLHFVTERLKALAKAVIRRFKAGGFRNFRTVVVTVRFADFETKTRSRTLEKPARSSKVLEFEALKILLPFFDSRENPAHKLIRLVGVRVEKLST